MDALTSAVAATLRAERAAAQLSQRELAERAGIGYQTVMRMEKGDRPAALTVGHLAAVCAVLGLSISELVERAEQRLR